MNSLYLRHVSYLTEESGLSLIIRKKLELDTHNKEVFQLFTPEFVNLMDHDIDKYINIISKYQESQNHWRCNKFLKCMVLTNVENTLKLLTLTLRIFQFPN